MRHTSKLVPALLLLVLAVACSPAQGERGDELIQLNSELTTAWPVYEAYDVNEDVELFLQPVWASDEVPYPFAGWEVSAGTAVQSSNLAHPDPPALLEFARLLFTSRYQGIAQLEVPDKSSYSWNLYRFNSGLDWEIVVAFPENHLMVHQPFNYSEDEYVFCDGDMTTGYCQLKIIDGTSVTNLDLPEIKFTGSPFKILSDGRAVVYDKTNALIYYRLTREDEWQELSVPAEFGAVDPYYTVFFEFQLVSDGFWALVNVYHSDDAYNYTSRFCRYENDLGWQGCREASLRRADAVLAMPDDSLQVFGVVERHVGMPSKYYEQMVQWTVSDTQVGEYEEVAFPRDLTYPEAGYVTTWPMMAATAAAGTGYVYVMYDSYQATGPVQTRGNLLYHFNGTELVYLPQAEEVLDNFRINRIFPFGLDRIISSNKYN